MPKLKKQPKKTVKLGLAPEQHARRSADFVTDARRFLRDVEDEVDAGNCKTAFSRLIDGISYAGMAEAEAQGAGQDAGPIASLAATAVKYFRKSCKVGE